MKKILSLSLPLFFVILCFTSGTIAKDNIRVGFSMALTGPYAPAAKGQMEAYLLWEEQVNKKGESSSKSWAASDFPSN